MITPEEARKIASTFEAKLAGMINECHKLITADANKGKLMTRIWISESLEKGIEDALKQRLIEFNYSVQRCGSYLSISWAKEKSADKTD